MPASAHESFWVVIGTAAPVVALANAVAISTSMSAALDALLAQLRRSEKAMAASLAPLRQRELERGRVGAFRLFRGVWRTMDDSAKALMRSYFLAGTGFIVNFLLLTYSLIALARGRDSMPPPIAVVLVTGGCPGGCAYLAVEDRHGGPRSLHHGS